LNVNSPIKANGKVDLTGKTIDIADGASIETDGELKLTATQGVLKVSADLETKNAALILLSELGNISTLATTTFVTGSGGINLSAKGNLEFGNLSNTAGITLKTDSDLNALGDIATSNLTLLPFTDMATP
jgi:hypothetical protein